MIILVSVIRIRGMSDINTMDSEKEWKISVPNFNSIELLSFLTCGVFSEPFVFYIQRSVAGGSLCIQIQLLFICYSFSFGQSPPSFASCLFSQSSGSHAYNPCSRYMRITRF